MHPDFRLATNEDAGLASRLVIAGWRDTYADFLPAALLDGLDRNAHHDFASWRIRIAALSARTWIVSKDGKEIGVARLDLDSSVPETRSELTTLYIDTARRSLGHGAAALGHVVQAVQQLGAWPMGLCVLSGNLRGRRFYERHGAQLVGERPVFEWEGRPITEAMYSMERRSNAHRVHP